MANWAKIIQITPLRLQVLISKPLTVDLYHKNNYDFEKKKKKISNLTKITPKGIFQPYLHFGSCTEASHFDRMDNIHIFFKYILLNGNICDLIKQKLQNEPYVSPGPKSAY